MQGTMNAGWLERVLLAEVDQRSCDSVCPHVNDEPWRVVGKCSVHRSAKRAMPVERQHRALTG